ncbi:MAG: hypothetical protein M3413_11265 [Bacteroidota bacterium]|jgi:ABC-type transport system involved in cytochrome c biogenesis permease subunit|nr:hypothetical protein [Flavisolibacter sp.]MDQ3552099.1 hypothetical protein [Bacteroidota bacterium]
MQTNRKTLMPLAVLFIVLNGFFISGKNLLNKWGTDQDVLIIGNLFLMIITLFSYLIASRGLKSENTHAFVRAVYSSILIKLFITLIAAFVYISVYRKELNKPAFFTLMGLYLLYSFIEVKTLTRQLKEKKNG